MKSNRFNLFNHNFLMSRLALNDIREQSFQILNGFYWLQKMHLVPNLAPILHDEASSVPRDTEICWLGSCTGSNVGLLGWWNFKKHILLAFSFEQLHKVNDKFWSGQRSWSKSKISTRNYFQNCFEIQMFIISSDQFDHWISMSTECKFADAIGWPTPRTKRDDFQRVVTTQ